MVTAEVQYATVVGRHLDPTDAAIRYDRAIRLIVSFARRFGWEDLGARFEPRGHVAEVGLQWHHATGRVRSHVFWPKTQDGLFVLSLAPKTGIIPATFFATGPGAAAFRAYAEVLYVLSRLNAPLIFGGRLSVQAEPRLRRADMPSIAQLFGITDADAAQVFASLEADGLLRRELPDIALH